MYYKDGESDKEIRDPDFCAELAAMEYRPDLRVDLPPVLSDQAARQFHNMLQNLAEQFYEHYAKQIERAHRTLARQQEEFLHGREAAEAQQELTFDDNLDDLSL